MREMSIAGGTVGDDADLITEVHPSSSLDAVFALNYSTPSGAFFSKDASG